MLDGLVVLRAVVEAGSFARAAEGLGVTQPAVSRAIARLEDRLAVRLFRRTARSSALTEEGERYYASIVPHLRAIEDATIVAGEANAAVRGRLRVNVDAGIAQYLLAARLGPFLERHPELFVELAMRERLGDLVRDGFDVAVRFGALEPSSLKARLLLRSRIVTCASRAYVARHGLPRTPRDVERHRCILVRNPATGAPFGWDFVRGKKRVSIAATGAVMVNGGGILMGACLEGLGVAQLLELYARGAIADGSLVHVVPEWSDETYALYAYHPPTSMMPPKVRAFLDYLSEITRA